MHEGRGGGARHVPPRLKKLPLIARLPQLVARFVDPVLVFLELRNVLCHVIAGAPFKGFHLRDQLSVGGRGKGGQLRSRGRLLPFATSAASSIGDIVVRIVFFLVFVPH